MIYTYSHFYAARVAYAATSIAALVLALHSAFVYRADVQGAAAEVLKYFVAHLARPVACDDDMSIIFSHATPSNPRCMATPATCHDDGNRTATD